MPLLPSARVAVAVAAKPASPCVFATSPAIAAAVRATLAPVAVTFCPEISLPGTFASAARIWAGVA